MRPIPETLPPQALTQGDQTILIVDDEEPIRRVCFRLLTKLGYTVLIASGGRQAIELLEKHRDQISLVILDMTMPEMSGSQTYKALRAVVPNCKVLLASGHSIGGQAQEILASGCNGFLQKPYNVAALGAKIREILRTSVDTPS
jgi:CheY-like chemotaxis protein